MTNEEIAEIITDFQMKTARDSVLGDLLDGGAPYATAIAAVPKIDAALEPIRQRLFAEHLEQVRRVHSSEGPPAE